MVRIRLRRIGSKRQPSYRMIVADAEAPRDGRFLEIVGFYNPRTLPETVQVNEERALHWLGVGAQPSESVTRLLTKCGTLGRFARLKSGEALDVLMAEVAQAARRLRPLTPRPRCQTSPARPAKKPSERHSRRPRPRLNNQRPSREPSPPCSLSLLVGLAALQTQPVTRKGDDKMKELIEYIAKSLVDDPSQVTGQRGRGSQFDHHRIARGSRRYGASHRQGRARGERDAHAGPCARRQRRQAGHAGNRVTGGSRTRCKSPGSWMPMDTPDSRGSGKRRIPEPRFLAVARVVKPWGVRGEMKLEVLTGFPDQLDRLKRVYLGPRPCRTTWRAFTGTAASCSCNWPTCATATRQKLLRDQLVQIAREDAMPLEPGQFYEHQIVGLSVVTTDGEPLGQVVEVLATGANDVYVVQGPRGEVLLPARVEVVRAIDLDAGTMTVTLLPGLVGRMKAEG